METGGNGESAYENRGGGVLDCSSLGNFTHLPVSDEVFEMIVSSEQWNGENSSFSCGWTSLDSVAYNVELVSSPISSHGLIGNSSNYLQQSQATSSASRLVQFQSDDNLAELELNIPCFDSGTYSEMDSFFFLHGCRWIANSGCSFDYPLDGSNNKTEKASIPQIAGDNYAQSQEEHKILDEGTAKPLTDGKKRRRMCYNWPQFPSLKDGVLFKNLKTEKDQGAGEQDGEKLKPEQKPVAKTCRQINGKEVKDSSTSGDAPNEDYVHVRAKRGQATNSHSLAERVRREKIRERMKFLEDLVPGCNKMTGKAIMLDEIINYVISLERQVEFLSVKLSTAFPETNVEPEQNLSRYIRQEALATQTSNIESSSMPNAARIWGSELQGTSQMDFISDLAPDKPESNGFIDEKL